MDRNAVTARMQISFWLRPVLSLNNSGNMLWHYYVAVAEIVPPNRLCDRNKKTLMVFFLVSLTCVVTSNHKQRKKSCHNMCHLQFLAMLEAAAAAAKALAEVVANGEAMVVEMMAETEAAAGAYNNQPKSGSNSSRRQSRRRQRRQPWQRQRRKQRGWQQHQCQQLWQQRGQAMAGADNNQPKSG